LLFKKKFLSEGMKQKSASKWAGICAVFAVSLGMAGCAVQDVGQVQPQGLAAPKKNINSRQKTAQNFARSRYSTRLTERSCLERAMFFESDRSSHDGLIAVGTIVMNRVHSSEYPNTICGVVGQRSQFAPGVLTRPMNIAALPDVAAAADAVLHGTRNPKLKNALYFHTAGLRFPYSGMHYVLVAGGNSFYEKRRRDGSLTVPVNDETYNVAYAFAQDRGEISPAANMLNSAVAPQLDNVRTASVREESAQPERARIMQASYHPGGESAAQEANASLSTVYDSRNIAEQSRANEARAEMASYAPDPDNAAVPVPQMKEAVSHRSAANGASERTPQFTPISAPYSADNSDGAIPEVGGRAGGSSAQAVSYVSPDMQKAGEVGAMLLNKR